MAEHKRVKPLVSLAVTNRKSSRSFLFNQNRQLCGWKNNQTGEERISRLNETPLVPASFTCVHVIEPAMLGMIKQTGKFSIIDTYLDLAKENHIHGYFHNQDCVIDVGKPESIKEAEKYFP